MLSHSKKSYDTLSKDAIFYGQPCIYDTHKFEKWALMKALQPSISSEDNAAACQLHEN